MGKHIVWVSFFSFIFILFVTLFLEVVSEINKPWSRKGVIFLLGLWRDQNSSISLYKKKPNLLGCFVTFLPPLAGVVGWCDGPG